MSNLTVSEEYWLWFQFLERVLEKNVPWVRTIFLVLMFVIFVIGLVGNLLTCIVIYYDKTMHTATNYYLFNLAVSDLIVTFAILLEVYEYLDYDQYFLHYAYGELTCKIHFFLVVTLWNNGILIMTALAVERYVAICYPLMLKTKPVWRRVIKVIVCIWVIAIAETLPEIWTVALIKTKSSSLCFIIPTHFAKIVNTVLALVTFLIPLAIMTFVYAMIAFQMNVVQNNSTKDRIFNHRDNRRKVKKLIVALTVSFLVCWVPFFSMRVLIITVDVKQLLQMDKWWDIMYKISALNCWFSAVLNPLLYSLMSTKFRGSLKNLWDRKVKRRQRQILYSTRMTTV